MAACIIMRKIEAKCHARAKALRRVEDAGETCDPVFVQVPAMSGYSLLYLAWSSARSPPGGEGRVSVRCLRLLATFARTNKSAAAHVPTNDSETLSEPSAARGLSAICLAISTPKQLPRGGGRPGEQRFRVRLSRVDLSPLVIKLPT